MHMHHTNSGNTHNSTKHETPENNNVIRFTIVEIKGTSAHMYINQAYFTGQVVHNSNFTNKVVYL